MIFPLFVYTNEQAELIDKIKLFYPSNHIQLHIIYALKTASSMSFKFKKNVKISSSVLTKLSDILFYMMRENTWKTEIIFLTMRRG